PIDAAAAQHRAGEPHVDDFLTAQITDAFQPFPPDRPGRHHGFIVVNVAWHYREEVAQVAQEGGRQVFPDTTDANVAHGQARATGHFKEIQDTLAFARGVHHHRQTRAGDIHDM